jgi:archaemetzincin
MPMPRPILVLCPHADLPDVVTGAVEGALASAFGVQVVVGPTFAVPPTSLDGARAQYLADAVLGAVPLPDGAGFSLGLVAVDLYTHGLSFVFGMACGRRALVSINRLGSDLPGPRGQALLLLRAITEAVHEVGHLFGLGHCRDRDCAMFFSNTLADTDRKGPTLCSRCRAVLRADHLA